MTAARVDREEKGWIASLLEQKSTANEAQRIALDRARVESIQSELERYKSAPELVAAPVRSTIGELDKFFRGWIEW